jgi:putative ABC transport system permease protein
MKFILTMAYREIRASWHRLLFFFLCIAVGVGSIVALRSLVQNVSSSVGQQAQTLLTADVQVQSNNPLGDAARATLDRVASAPPVLDRTEIIELATMMRPVGRPKAAPKMVEIKAVQPAYPFYGVMDLSGGQTYSPAMLANRGVLLRSNLMTQMSLSVGDRVKIGTLEFTVRGSIEREPGNTLNAFSFGPRVVASYDDIKAAGLTGFGSRARYKTLLKVREGEAETVSRQLKRELSSQPLVSVRSFRDAENRVAESFTRVENYLSLIGLIILVLGGIGISSVTRVFVQQKMKTIAILKCLGGRNSKVLGTYLIQVLALGVAGSVLGLGFARLIVYLVPRYLAEKMPPDVQVGLTWPATLQGFGVGVLIALLFAALPLLEVRRVKPILVLRSNEGGKKKFDWLKLAVGLVVVASLVALAGWQAGSLKIGALFLGGLGLTAGLLSLSGTLLIRFLRSLRHIPSFALRQGVNSLYRPGNQTKVILMAVGLGAFFIISVRSLQENLLHEFNLDLSGTAADLYLIDIQPDQRAPLAAEVQRAVGVEPQLIPTLRARIAAVNGEPVNPDSREGGERRGFLLREYTLTYRPHREESEKIIAGRFWDPTPGDEPEISIEEALQQSLKLNLGDSLTFDLAGQRITARVTSVRKVDWRNARIGFLVVFRPGALESFPQNLITAVKGPAPGAGRAEFQRAVVDKFPNVSVIDVYDILESASKVINTVSLAVTFIGGFVLLSGLLILVGSIAMTKYHRLYESAILKTLGAKRKLIVLISVIEYGMLGLLAGLIGSAAAVALTWAVSKYGLDIAWTFLPSVNALGVAATLALVTLIGVLSSWDVMVKKPLGILRAE